MKNVRFKWNKDNRSWWQKMPINGKICAIVCAVCLCAIFAIGYFVKMSSDPKTIIYTVLALAFFLIFIMGITSAFSSTYTALKVGEVSDDVALATKNDYAHWYAEGKLPEGSDEDEYLDLNNAPDDKRNNGQPLPQTLSKEELDKLNREMRASHEQGTDETEKMLLRRYLIEMSRNGMPDEKVKETTAILNSAIQESKSQQPIAPAKTAQLAKSNQNQQPAQPAKPVEVRPQQHSQLQQPNNQKPVTPTQAPVAKPEQVKHPDNVVAVIFPGENTGEIDVQRVRRETAKNDPSDGLPGLGRGKWDRTGEPPSIEEQMAEIGLGKNAKVVLTSALSKGSILMKSRCCYWGDLPPSIMDELRSFLDVRQKTDTHSDAVGQ